MNPIEQAVEDLRAISSSECRCWYSAEWYLNNEPRPEDGGHHELCHVSRARAALAALEGLDWLDGATSGHEFHRMPVLGFEVGVEPSTHRDRKALLVILPENER